MLFTNFNMAVFMGLQRYEVSNIVGFARSGLTQIIAVIIVFWGGRVFEVLMGSVLVLWGCAILSSILAIRMLIPHGLGFFFLGLRQENIVFSTFILLQNLGSQIFSSVDKLVVGRVLGVEAVAYYSVGVSVSARLLQVVGSLTHVLLPSSSEAVADKNYRRLYSLFWRSTKISAFLSYR